MEESPADGSVASGAARPRVIEGQEVKVDEPAPCTIEFSQDSISLINDGGSVGILVTLNGASDIKNLTAASSSAKDVSVSAEPEIAGFPNRRFYVIKSVSTSLGMYQVTFAAPCGKKDLIVSVR